MENNYSTYNVIDPHCGMEIYEQCETVRLIKKVIFSVTITMDVVALIVLILYRKYQSFSQRIFLNILLSNLVEGIAHLMDDGVPGNKCIFSAFLVQAAGFALFMWVGALTLFLFILIIRKANSEHYERRFIIVCWGVPLILGIIPFVTGDYGPAGAFCWITNYKPEGNVLRLVIWWVPVPLGLVIIMVAFIMMIYKATRASFSNPTDPAERQRKKMVTKYLWPLAGYGVSFIFLHTFMLVDRLITFAGHPPLYPMRILHIISISFYGTILCTLFYLTNGKKELSREKLLHALEQHKNHILCQRLGFESTTAFTRTVNIQDSGYVHSMAFSNTPPTSNVVDVDVDVAVISGPTAGGSNHQQVSIEYERTEEFELPKSILKKKNKKRKKGKSGNSLSLTFGVSFSDCHGATAKDSRPKRRPPPLSTVPKEKQQSSISDDESMTPEPIPVDALDETLDILRPRCCTTDQRENQRLSLRLETNVRYELPRDSEMVKIYLIEDRKSRWEMWKDSQSLESFILALQKSLRRTLMVLVHDTDGAYFGEQVTWSQIKSCTDSIRIIINEGVTGIDFTSSTEPVLRAGVYHNHRIDPLDYPTKYDSPSCV